MIEWLISIGIAVLIFVVFTLIAIFVHEHPIGGTILAIIVAIVGLTFLLHFRLFG